jgi:hypothetical protein
MPKEGFLFGPFHHHLNLEQQRPTGENFGGS